MSLASCNRRGTREIALVVRQVAPGFMGVGEKVQSQSWQDFDVRLSPRPIVLECAETRPETLGAQQTPGSRVPTERHCRCSGPRAPDSKPWTLECGTCLLSWAPFVSGNELVPSLFSFPSKAKARSGKLHTTFSQRIKAPPLQGKFYKPVMSMMQGEDHTV